MCCKYHIRAPTSSCRCIISSPKNFHYGLSHWCRVIPRCALDLHTSYKSWYSACLHRGAFFFKQLEENLQLIIFLLSFCCFQSLSPVSLFVTPWTAACQAPLSFTISQSFLKFLSIESVVLPNHLILCHSLLLLPSIFPRIRVFSNESVLHIRWPKYWSFSFGISPSIEYSELISFRMDWFDLLAVIGNFKSLF